MDEDKGRWAEVADAGIVPPPKSTDDDRQLRSDVVGEEAADDEPATDGGVDLSAGDNADATTDGGAEAAPGAEPDLKDAAAMPRKPDIDSAR